MALDNLLYWALHKYSYSVFSFLKEILKKRDKIVFAFVYFQRVTKIEFPILFYRILNGKHYEVLFLEVKIFTG